MQLVPSTAVMNASWWGVKALLSCTSLAMIRSALAAAVHRFCPCSTTYDHLSHTCAAIAHHNPREFTSPLHLQGTAYRRCGVPLTVEVVGVVWSVVAVCHPRRSDIKCVADGWFGKSPSEREPREQLRGASPLAVTCGAARTQGDGATDVDPKI